MLVFWIVFNVFVAAALILDLAVLRKDTRPVSMRGALITTGIWVLLAALFAATLYFWHGPQAALEFSTGYVVEEALSIDNLFVFLFFFSYFKIKTEFQRKVLFWGIFGALVMRGLFIFLGVTLINKFHWVAYVFGVFVIYTGAMLLKKEDEEKEPEKRWLMRQIRRFLPVSEHFHGGKFFVRESGQARGRLMITSLFVVLIMLEVTDVLFATDSVPAVLAITRDPFIVYTSNVFAILGLRSLYFALAGMMTLFHYLNYGLSAILIFIGIKMVVADFFPISTLVSLGTIALILGIAIGASMVFPQEPKAAATQS